MAKRELEKFITWTEEGYEDRKFRIKKMDALTGSYVGQVILTKGLGIIGPVLASKVGAEMPQLPKGLPSMTKQEFFELQRDLLSACSEVLPAGNTSVIGDNGLPSVMNFEDNLPLVLTLTAHSLAFNVSDFFDESLLKGLKESFAGISLFKPKTSDSTSGDQ